MLIGASALVSLFLVMVVMEVFWKMSEQAFLKNQTLFPIFGLDGPPMWAMVQSMVCTVSKRRVSSNSALILCRLPLHVAATYPVHPRYALPNHSSHLRQTATDIFDQIMGAFAAGYSTVWSTGLI
jgi:hypothetical protein